MKPEELRIGNYVRAKSPEKTEWIERHKISAHTLYSMVYPHAMDIVKPDLEPIPITKEWLSRFGFDSYLFLDPRYTSNCRRFVFDIRDMSIQIGHSEIHFECKHVHQLQNIYYALTGEELKLKS